MPEFSLGPGFEAIVRLVMASTLFGCAGPSHQDPSSSTGGAGGGGGSGVPDAGDIFEYKNDGSCQPLLVDSDGDGYGAGTPKCRSWSAFGSPPPAGFSLKSGDCDDSDPKRHQFAYRDADGDGAGDPANASCVDATLPQGTVERAGDCNDHDPTAYPGAPEQWFDAVDSDCDGNNDPFDCTATPTPCGCAEAAADPGSVPVSPTCPSADLVITKTVECPTCALTHPLFAVIANQGSAVAADITLERTLDGKKLPAVALPAGTLVSGSSSRPLNVGSAPGKLELRLTTSSTECDATNNAAIVWVVTVDCK